MILARFIVMLAALIIALSVAAYVLTGNRRYARFAWRTFLATVAAMVVFFGVILLERLLLI